MLRKLNSLACFLAALLALIVEACFAYYIQPLPSANLPASPFPSSGEWIRPTLPQCWLAGALFALFDYLILALRANPEKTSQGRRTFLRTWYWFLAFASAQGCALYVGRLPLVQR
jgi:hypothetical protein